MKKYITSDIVVSYVQCPRKAYLLLHGGDEAGRVNEYAAIHDNRKSINENAYFENLRKQYPGLVYSDNSNMINGDRFLMMVMLQSKYYEAACSLLNKISVPSSLGKYSYEPYIFVGTHQINSDQKLELIFIGYVLGQVQGQRPTTGKIISVGQQSHEVNLEKGYERLEAILEGVQEIHQEKFSGSPSLIMNKHCSYCQYQYLCRTQAEKEDNLSLLDRATEKVIKKYHSKGIFTVNQLSYLYKPRRRGKRSRKAPPQLHRLELQALAIRTNKIYLQEPPQITRKPVELFLDIEGIPDQQYEYLIGLIVCKENNSCEHYAFWADTCEDETIIWRQFIEILIRYPDAPIYHYGNYEVRAIHKLGKNHELDIDIESIESRLVNVNAFIFGQVYFPVYSNGLKSIGNYIGAKWTSPDASGLQSIIWRYHWDDTKDTKYKEVLIVYNHEDCKSLMLLTEKLSNIQGSASLLSDVDYADQPKKLPSDLGLELHNHFDSILKFAHEDYKNKKISLRRNDNGKQEKVCRGAKKGHQGHTKELPRTSRTIGMPTRAECPEHKGELLVESERYAECVVIDLVFAKGIKKTVLKYTGKMGFCQKCHRHYNPDGLDINYFAYGHGLQSWVAYHRLFLRLPYRIIKQALYDQFEEKVSTASFVKFLKYFSHYYAETERIINDKILNNSFIHADETKINIQGVDQYVWVFTDGANVVFKLTPTRESDIVHQFLGDYSGVLVTDFYPGYDSVKCKQQKCWVHLIRDINDDLWRFPFDSEYERFVIKVRDLILPILEAVEKFGLKKRHLNKFLPCVEHFYECVINARYKSDLAIKYQKRFLRYRSSLFVFLTENGIPWNNNAGERAIRHLAVQRKISGSFFESMTPHYLRLLGIMQTCRFQEKSLLKFLLSKEIDIDQFK